MSPLAGFLKDKDLIRGLPSKDLQLSRLYKGQRVCLVKPGRFSTSSGGGRKCPEFISGCLLRQRLWAGVF